MLSSDAVFAALNYRQNGGIVFTQLSIIAARQAKEWLEGAGFQKGGHAVVLGGATIAGFFASACSLPFDFVKTRIQKMEPGPDGKFPYNGPVDCALKTLRQEGPLKFYTGFPTYCVRCALPAGCWCCQTESVVGVRQKVKTSSKSSTMLTLKAAMGEYDNQKLLHTTVQPKSGLKGPHWMA